MKRAVLSVLLCACLAVAGCPSASAKESVHNPDIAETASLRYGESNKTTLLATETKSIVVTPGGQPSGGYKLPSGGSINVRPESGSNISVSVAATWGPVRITTTIGYTGAGVSSISIPVPSANYYYKAKLRKYYKLSHVKIDYYEYGVLKYTTYTTQQTYLRTEGFAQRV
ncbi:hypothetical protein JS528_05915 [Bifidobacterium sp. MA2]|uniref:Lipoprotein n=1 Tax=Bifidobacterium santillanense TaxID=2809028 RepID=A0ABS5UPN5_9BIFI|nr:hypothetical protein [Bifidobacterium santillanense]MBT1172896.1 hypothetical protein [Bifidobacterium santillanense]